MLSLQLDKLGLSKMASGHLCLNLSEKISWEIYPDFAESIIKICDGTVKDKVESPEMRIWIVVIAQQELRLVYEDYPQLVSLESCSDEADQLIKNLYAKLSGM